MKVTQRKCNYLKEGLDLHKWVQVKEELVRILDFNIKSTCDLRKVIEWSNELLDETEYIDIQNYVKYSLDMTNEHVNKALSEYKAQICDPSRVYFRQIEEKIMSSKYYEGLDESFDHYKNLLQRNQMLSCKKNDDLLVEEERFCLEYRKMASSVQIDYKGGKYTRSETNKLLSSLPEEEKKDLWIQMNEAWLEKKPILDSVFNRILAVRQEIALNCGMSNYGEYLHLKHSRFDYSLSDIKQLHRSVEKKLVPSLRKYASLRSNLDGSFSSHPWMDDYNYEKVNLAGFDSPADLVEKVKLILKRIDNEFSSVFESILLKGNIDLTPKNGKTTGGFSFPIDRNGSPFICMNVAGRLKEVSILIHEIGHGVHAVFNADQKIRDCRMFSSNGELAEFPPKFFELVSLEHYDLLYKCPQDQIKAKTEFYMEVLDSFIRYIVIDSFEHWLYNNPGHTVQERDDYYSALVDRFNINDNWTDFEHYKPLGWYNSQLVVIMPFYIISYAIAQVGAINLYKTYLHDNQETIQRLKDMMVMGFSRPIGELYELAGIKFDFSEEELARCISFLENKMAITH